MVSTGHNNIVLTQVVVEIWEHCYTKVQWMKKNEQSDDHTD